MDGAGFGVDRPAELTKSDDEYDAFRKRMMLAYRFRPNPLVSLLQMLRKLVYFMCLTPPDLPQVSHASLRHRSAEKQTVFFFIQFYYF